MESKVCELCKGACCETFVLQPRQWGWSDETTKWIELRGVVETNGVRIYSPCKNLICGVCSDYENRPEVCKVYEVGSESCRNAIKIRRPFKDVQEALYKLIENKDCPF